MKKIIMLFLLLLPISLAFDLSNYPNFFIDNRTIDSVVIIGDALADEPAALNFIKGIKLSEFYMLNFEEKPRIMNFVYDTPLRKSSEITNLYEKNVIIIGGPCANPVAARIMNSPANWPNCSKNFKQDFATIKLYNNYGKYQLLIAGYDAKDTLRATNAFINFTHYELSGDEIEVNTYTENIKLRKIE